MISRTMLPAQRVLTNAACKHAPYSLICAAFCNLLPLETTKCERVVEMRKSDFCYVVESPHDVLHDMFYDASEASENFHAIIIPNARGFGGFGFVIRRNEMDAENFAVSDFEFESESEVLSFLGEQLPYVEVGRHRRSVKIELD